MAEPTPEPFATGHLDVGDGHVLYYEEVGAPEGTPVVYLHGGPGAGCTPGARRWFDLRRHRAVLFDQRAAGRSRPHASGEGVHWASIDMAHHIGDIERFREHFGIERWIASRRCVQPAAHGPQPCSPGGRRVGLRGDHGDALVPRAR